MHKKKIKNIDYYYTSIRENGRVKTIYLGRDEKKALRKENELKGIFEKEPEKIPLGREKTFPKPILYIFVIFIALGLTFFFRAQLTGFFIASLEQAPEAIQIGIGQQDFLPKDTLVEMSINDKTSVLTLEEIMSKTNADLKPAYGDFYSEGTALSGSGYGFGAAKAVTLYPEINFEYRIDVYETRSSEIEKQAVVEVFNETTNETYNETIITYETVTETVLLESKSFISACSFENPYSIDIKTLGIASGENITYNVSLIPESIKSGEKQLSETDLSMTFENDILSITTAYSETLEPEPFSGTTINMSPSDFGLEFPEESGTYELKVRAYYGDVMISEQSKEIIVEEKDSDSDGIPDKKDKCPMTPQGEEVITDESNEFYGCSQSEIFECATGETAECYPDDPKTMNIGICASGYRECIEGKWSECTGWTGPQEEICDNGVDEDCNGKDEKCKKEPVSPDEVKPYKLKEEKQNPDGTRSLILYSKPKYVYEDDKWKDVENARSLRGVYKVSYLETDERFSINVTDFNLTSIQGYVSVSPEFVGIDVPLRVLKQTTEGNIIADEIMVNIQSDGESQFFQFDNFSPDYVLKFGENSTTIKLQSTENFADITLSYSGRTYFYYGGQIKWNISSVPDGMTIEDSKLCLYWSSITGSPNNDVRIWRVDDQSWDETTSPLVIGSQTTTDQVDDIWSSIMQFEYGCTNTTTAVSSCYNSGAPYNCSIRFYDLDAILPSVQGVSNGPTIDIGNTSITGGYLSGESRSGVNGPYLNITYGPTGGDSPPNVTLHSPVINTNLTNVTVTFNCSAWDDYNLTNITLYGNWSSGWHANETNTSVANNTYTIFTKNITPDGYYKWNCQACDNSGNCNFSAANYTFKVDTTPPTPNPAQISTALATNATQIVVVAGPAIDTLSPPVEYQYNETTGGSGSTNSSWQSGISYSDDDLSTNTSYCYIVQYRDALNNIGEPSSESCVFTLAETPSISSVLCAYSGGYQCTVAFDMKTNPAGTLRYINETTGLGNDSTWSTSTANYVDTGLAAHTEYCYTIKAKNGDDLETVYSDEVCDTMDNRLPGAASNLLPTSTHNLTQNMTWTEGTDPDGDPVSSFFCVATSDTKRNNTDCDVHASNESDPWYQFTGGELSFNAGGANRTFYTRIISNDNYSGNSSNYDTSFLLYNNEPSQSSVAIAPTGPNVTSTLNCTYTFSDPNSDTENTTGTQFQWYVQNEGSGNFVLNASATSQTFSGGFDKDDKVICSVKVEDQYGLEALSFTNSSSVTILNSVPPKVNLSYPVNGDTLFTNRTPKFNWTAVTDPDPEDSVTYHFQLSLNNDCSDPIKNVTSIADNYYLQTTELDFATYYWRVRANDSVSTYGNWSDIWNFTLVPSVDIFMLNNVTDFGGMAPGDSNDTADNSPLPFKLRNDGNTEANVSVNATDLWSAAALGTHYYQFKANQSDELNSFNWTLSQTTWANMSDSRALAIAIFNHTNSNDTAAIDIRVEAKTNEPPGTKSSTIEIYYEEA